MASGAVLAPWSMDHKRSSDAAAQVWKGLQNSDFRVGPSGGG